MHIRKDTIYFINHETIEQFIKDVLSSGLGVRDDIRSKTNYFGELIYIDKRYVPMSFQEHNDYVYFSSDNSCRTLEQTMECIEEANSYKTNRVYRHTMGEKVELYSPKRMLL